MNQILLQIVVIADMMQQGIDLQVKPHIVISTPGRLADHLQSCDTFSLRKIKFLVSKKYKIDVCITYEIKKNYITINHYFFQIPHESQNLIRHVAIQNLSFFCNTHQKIKIH